MALKGLKVIELAGLAPAPFCGMILADFGASVLRIDKVGPSMDVDCLGNGKQSISLNLKHPKGVSILRSLCKESDVLLEPYRKGVMDKLGLGPEILLKDNPKLIYARLTGYGQHGCLSERAGHDINYLSLSGLLSLFGRKGEKPMFPVNLGADFGGGGLMCALGILLALYERQSSGLGQVIDCSMVEGTAYLGSWLYRSQNLPLLWGHPRGQNYLDGGAHFYEVYETKDGKFMAVGALEPQFYEKLLEGLEISHDDAPQMNNFDQSKALFAEKFKEKTQDEWCSIFEHTDACVTPVLSLNDAPIHAHNWQRQSFNNGTNAIAPNPAPILSRTPSQSNASKPPLKNGQHTTAVLKNLGYSDVEISRLIEQNVIETFNNSKL